jgi:hypothetical protein
MVLCLSTALAAFLGCDGEPSIGITTALPMKQPPGQNESLMQSMCEPLRKYKNEHIKVMWLKPGPRSGVVFTRTYFCSDVLREDFKALP